MNALLKRAPLAALLLVWAAVPALADEESAAREAIRAFIEDLDVRKTWEHGLTFKATILKSRDPGRLWVEETLHHPLRGTGRGAFPSIQHYLFADRLNDLVGPVRALLNDSTVDAVNYGLDIVEREEITSKFVPELSALSDRQDEVGERVLRWGFHGVGDPGAVEHMIAEARKSGNRALAALGALADTPTLASHEYLRTVAADPSETKLRREYALGGLRPFMNAEDERVVLEALAGEDEGLATVAFCDFYNSTRTPPLALLRKARSTLPAMWTDAVDAVLVRGGDEEMLDEILKRACDCPDESKRRDLFAVAGKSPLPGRVAKFAKVLPGESQAWSREPLLVALGRSGDPAALDAIVPWLGTGEAREMGAEALGDLARSGGVGLREAVLVLLKQRDRDLLRPFVEAWLGRVPAEADRLTLAILLVDLLEKHAGSKSGREVLARGLLQLAPSNLGDERADIPKWRSWLEDELRKAKKE